MGLAAPFFSSYKFKSMENRQELFEAIERIFGITPLASEMDEVQNACAPGFIYMVFDAKGNFYTVVFADTDAHFEHWNTSAAKPGLRTSSIRVFTNNPKTTYGRLSGLKIK